MTTPFELAPLALGRKSGPSLSNLIHQVSHSRLPLLLTGDSGTGKNLLAQMIHRAGPWAQEPFSSVDCGAFAARAEPVATAQALEQVMERAKTGTVLFDHIDESPPHFQSALLRVLERNRPEESGVGPRIISAAAKDLAASVQCGHFRGDVYYRLNVISYTLPPLRECENDLPMLIEHLLLRLSGAEHQTSGRSQWQVTPQAMKCLLSYHWPGNFRELENCLQRATTFATDGVIRVGDLPEALQSAGLSGPAVSAAITPLREVERLAIERALVLTKGDRLLAARALGIGRTTLYRKLRQYGAGNVGRAALT